MDEKVNSWYEANWQDRLAITLGNKQQHNVQTISPQCNSVKPKAAL